MMIIKKITYFTALLLCCASMSTYATVYYNISGSSSLQNTNQWGVNTNGTGTHPSSFTHSGDVFNIYNGSTTSISANWTLATGVTINIGNGTSAMYFSQPSVNITSTCTINVANGSTFYIGDNNTGILGTLGATSTVEYGSTNSFIIQAATYGYLVYSSTSTSSSFETGTSPINIQGDFTISSGLVTVNKTSSTSITINVGGDFNMSSNGRLVLASNASASATFNVNGNVSVSSSGSTVINFCSATSTTSAVSIFQANGDVSLNGTGTNIIEWGKGSISGNYFGVKGNLTISGSAKINTSSSSTAAMGFVFNGTGTVQQLSNTSTGSTSSTECSYEVNSGAYVRLTDDLTLGTGTTIHSDLTVVSGATLDCSTYNISGGSTGGGGVYINSGARLITANTGGINSSVTATGSTFDGGANYEFNGSSAQVTGTDMPNAIVAPGSVTINNSAGVTLSQSTSFASGDTLNLRNGNFTIGSSLSMSSGSYVVRDNGTLSATPSTYSGINLTYANLGNNSTTVTTGNEFPSSLTGSVTVNKTGATITLNNSKTLTGSLAISAGTLDVSSSNYQLTINGNWTNNGTFTARSGTVLFNATTSGKTITGSMTGSNRFYNLTFNGSGGAWSFGSSAADVGNNFTITAGTVTAPSSTLQVAGNWSNSGTFTNNSGTVVMNATTTGKTLSGSMTGSNKFYNLTFNGSGGAWSFGSSAVDAGNNFTITAGTVTAPSSTLQVAGNWSNSGTFTNNSGTVVMNATTTGKTLSGSMTGSNKFNNLTFNGSGGAWSFGTNAADVDNNFTITAGTVTAPSSTLQVAGNWSNSGIFTNNSGTVVMNATSTGNTLSGSMTGSNKFYNLTFNGSGGAWSFGSSAADAGNNFTITTGTVTAPSSTLQVAGNWSNSGTFTHNGGVVTMNKSGSQTIGGTSANAFNSLTISSGSTTTISTAGQTLRSILQSNGTLNTGGYLTLLSSSSQTALIDGAGSGSVLGNVTMQRYLDSSFGYRYISSPFQAATLSQLSGYINLSASFPNFYGYNENVNYAGWVIDTAVADTIKPMRGYAANFGSSFSASTISLTGVVNNGSMSYTLYNHNNTYTLGFNFVGNPYPSPINWTASSGWTKTNIDNAIYFFNHGDTNQYYGRYSSYIGGVSSDGIANNIIPAMQGFFVHVSNGSYPVTGTLTFTNSVRTTGLTPHYFRTTAGTDKPLIRLTAGYSDGDVYADPTVIYFDDMGTADFEGDLDALKLMNTDVSVPSFYSVSDDGHNLSIQALPSLTDSSIMVPLGLNIERDGMVVLKAKDIENIPSDMHLWFYDTRLGKCQDLQNEPQYSVQLSAGKHLNRFFLMASKSDKINIPGTDAMLNAYTSGSSIFVYLTSGTGNVVVTNIAGQVVARQTISGNGYHEIKTTLSSGVYIATLYSSMGKQSKKVFLGNE